MRTLLREYAAHLNSSSEGEHICLENYEQELAALPGVYAQPRGVLLLAFVDREPAGVVGLKPLAPKSSAYPDDVACEMKRLWVRPGFRGLRLGLRLTEALIEYATGQGYTAMYLDTLPAAMQAANRLYRQLGFEAVECYQEKLSFTTGLQAAFFRLDLLAAARRKSAGDS